MVRIKGHVQGATTRSTLDSLNEAIDSVEPDETLFCFAYCTMSGFSAFHNRVGSYFWDTPSRWLLGIDYGRSQPTALREIGSKPNASVKIHAGLATVQRPGFVPMQDFHLKACFLRNSQTNRAAVLAGSGNFSSNGLSKSIECGLVLTTRTVDEYRRLIRPLARAGENLWANADDLDQVLVDYTRLWTPGARPQSPAAPTVINTYQKFWIEVGYVTQNRGGREGNQFDMPRGVHSFFGLRARPNQRPNTTIGQVTFVGNGLPLTRALRLGNNLMEKMTLPFPEDYSFGTYSGKILEFTRARGGFSIDAYELDEFEMALRRSPASVTLKMGSGRTYGYR